MAVLNLAAVGAAVAAEIPKIIRDGIEREVLGKPNFIADGTPESLPGQIGQAAARSACRQYAAGNSGLTGRAAVNAETACRPYLDDLNPGGSPAIKSPFSGGQCAGRRYRVIAEYTTVLANGQDASPPVEVNASGGPDGWIGPIGGVAVRGTPGALQLVLIANGQDNLLQQSNAPQGDFRNARIVSVTPADGGTDECGNPPPEITQPRQDPDDSPPPFRFNPGPLIDLPIDVTINPDGTIGVDIGGGTLNVDAFNGGGEGGETGAPSPGDIGSPGAGEDTGVAGEAEGQAPEGQVLTGIRVVLTAFPATRTLLENGVYRGAYYAYMGVPGLLDLDPAGAAATLDQFIFAEQPNLTAWRLRTNSGYNATVTPYYRTPE